MPSHEEIESHKPVADVHGAATTLMRCEAYQEADWTNISTPASLPPEFPQVTIVNSDDHGQPKPVFHVGVNENNILSADEQTPIAGSSHDSDPLRQFCDAPLPKFQTPAGLPEAEQQLKQGSLPPADQVALGAEVGVVKAVYGIGNGFIDMGNAILSQPLRLGNFLANSIKDPEQASADGAAWGKDTGMALVTATRVVLAADSYLASVSEAEWHGDFFKVPRDAYNTTARAVEEFNKQNPGEKTEQITEATVALGVPIAASKTTSILASMQEKMTAFIEKSDAIRARFGITPPETAPAYAMATGEHESGGEQALKMVGGASSARLTFAERLAKATGGSTEELQERLAELKAADPEGKKLLEINAILKTCETTTNFKPSADALFSSLTAEQLGAYRGLLEELGPINNLQDYSGKQIKDLSRSVERNLRAFERAAQTNDPHAIDAAVRKIEDQTAMFRMIREPLEAPENPEKAAERVMPLGIHEYTLEEVKEQFVTNPTRERIYEGLVKTLKELKEHGCKRVYLNGSFTTGKWNPKDFDLTWEPAGVDRKGLDPVLTGPTWRSTTERKDKYLGDIFIRDRAMTGHDHVEQWQHDLRTGVDKGLITIDLEKTKL